MQHVIPKTSQGQVPVTDRLVSRTTDCTAAPLLVLTCNCTHHLKAPSVFTCFCDVLGLLERMGEVVPLLACIKVSVGVPSSGKS